MQNQSNSLITFDMQGFEFKPVTGGLPPLIGPFTTVCLAYKQALVSEFSLRSHPLLGAAYGKRY